MQTSHLRTTIHVYGLRWLVERLVICYLVHLLAMNQFYVILPSDSSMSYFPDNTVAHYTTRLSHRICNDGEYEVALSELIYPMNFNHVDASDPLMFRYDTITKQSSFLFQSSQMESASDKSNKAQATLHGNEISDSHRQHLMYVYSDIVCPYLVGDVRTPLLRVVVPKGGHNEMISQTFNTLYYVPVARRDFDTIQIHINNELGSATTFSDGKSLAVLHFRRSHESLSCNTAFG